MKNKKWFVGAGTAVGLALVMVVMLMSALTAQAAPEAVVTPVSAPGDRVSDANVRYPINFMVAKAVTADGRPGTTYSLPGYSILDLQYVIDQGTTNTVTLQLQNSCDGVNWVTQGTIVTSNAADGSNIIQLNNYCRYAAIYANVTNSNPVTITVIGVAK